MVVPLQVPRWSSDRWGSRGGWGLILTGLLPYVLVGVVAVFVWSPDDLGSGPAAGDVLIVLLFLLAMLGWAVPAVVLGRRLLRAPEVDAGDVAFVVRDPALLTAPLVIPWSEVDRVEHLRELDPWGSPEGLNCSFTGVTGLPAPRFPNLLVRVREPRVVPEARSGWLGPWPLTLLNLPSPYLMPRPSRTRTTRGFFVIVGDPEAVIARHAEATAP